MSKVVADARAMPFFEIYSRGEAKADEIDDCVDCWHESADAQAVDMTLHDYLGLTEAEYDLWVQAPRSLPNFLRARRAG